jgi:hypothetical protein
MADYADPAKDKREKWGSRMAPPMSGARESKWSELLEMIPFFRRQSAAPKATNDGAIVAATRLRISRICGQFLEVRIGAMKTWR